MREIKFRAWDKNKKEFNDCIRMTLDGDRIEEDDYGNMPNMKDDIILMQYTGLKDNNGKEIYEGDILECHGDKIKKEKFILKDFIEDTSYLNAEINGHMSGLGIVWEVIGNIYENPELLTN